MKTETLKLYQLNYKDVKAYLATSAFVAGNILLPQLFHLVPNGGVTFLPIYFFTLIGAYKYGWKVGLLTAVCSPFLNYLLFNMPQMAALPAIMLKSSLLAIASGIAARYFQRISIPILIGVVLISQVLGTLGEWLLKGSFYIAVQDFRIGIPGMLLQIFGGYAIIRYILRK
jgi:hypothetical protein